MFVVKIIFLIFNILCIYMSIANAQNTDWDYTGIFGPPFWKGTCRTGKLQSPINIIPLDTVKAKPGRKLKFSKAYYAFNFLEIENDGKTVMLKTKAGETSNLQVEGAGWKGRYALTHISFHWGRNDSVGSEHTVKGRRFPLEVQFHHKQVNGGGIGIISLIFGISPTENKAFRPILDSLTSAEAERNTGGPVPMTFSVNLTALFPNVWDVFRYSGSLTTPPCTEGVLWSVFTQRMPISKNQVQIFRSIQNNDGETVLRTFRNLNKFYKKDGAKIYWMKIDKRQMRREAF